MCWLLLCFVDWSGTRKTWPWIAGICRFKGYFHLLQESLSYLHLPNRRMTCAMNNSVTLYTVRRSSEQNQLERYLWNHPVRMNPLNAFKKWFLNILVPYIEGMPIIDGANKKKNLYKEQRFRDLFKKRKSALILGTLVFCLIVFGIGKSIGFFTGLIVCSSFVVIFWNSFGERIISMFKFKKEKKWTKNY